MQQTIVEKLKELFRNRLVPVGLVLFVAFLIMIVHIFRMQMVEPEKTKITRDEKSYTKTVSLPSTRGNIYYRNGNLLSMGKRLEPASLVLVLEQQSMIMRLSW